MHDSLTHIDEQGQVSMVDVSSKEVLNRKSIAQGLFVAKVETLDALVRGDLPKGEGLAVARIAGIQAAKQCSNLIPLCHPLSIDCVDISFNRITSGKLQITATVSIQDRTGVEMEALTAVMTSALTIYDMGKAVDRAMHIEGVRLVRKRGGKSGDIDLE